MQCYFTQKEDRLHCVPYMASCSSCRAAAITGCHTYEKGCEPPLLSHRSCVSRFRLFSSATPGVIAQARAGRTPHAATITVFTRHLLRPWQRSVPLKEKLHCQDRRKGPAKLVRRMSTLLTAPCNRSVIMDYAGSL